MSNQLEARNVARNRKRGIAAGAVRRSCLLPIAGLGSSDNLSPLHCLQVLHLKTPGRQIFRISMACSVRWDKAGGGRRKAVGPPATNDRTVRGFANISGDV